MLFTVSDLLSLSELEGIRLVAGAGGVDGAITRTSFIDNPDAADWLIAGEFLLTSGFIFQEDPELQNHIIADLSGINGSGLCIKLGRYLDKVPDILISEADRLDFPLLVLPFGYSLSATSDIINRRLYSETERQMKRTMEIHREIMSVALTAGDLDGLAEMLSRLTENAVLITDSRWQLLSLSERPDNLLPLSQYLNTEPRAVPFPDSFLSTLPTSLRHYRKPIRRLFSPDGEHRIPCHIQPIAARSSIYGFLIIWETGRELEETDYFAMEQTARVAALDRMRAEEVEQAKLRARKDFLDSLLSGSIASQNALRSLAAVHGLSIDCSYRAMVVEGVSGMILQDSDAYLTTHSEASLNMHSVTAAVLSSADAEGLTVVPVPHGTELVLLIEWSGPATDEAIRRMAENTVRLLTAEGGRPPLILIAGRPVPGLADISRSVANAYLGTRMSRSLPQHSVIFMEDYAVYELLSEHVSRESLAKLVKNSLEPLTDYDEKNRTELVRTLELYYIHAGNIREAARDIFVHRNTYTYRLEKISSLLGADLHNPAKALELQLALIARRILEG